jgi:hypothetical protein
MLLIYKNIFIVSESEDCRTSREGLLEMSEELRNLNSILDARIHIIFGNLEIQIYF